MVMGDFRDPASVTIRPAVPQDADGVARTFVDSADHHARLDPERYAVPDITAIAARYRDGRQHPSSEPGRAVTLVAESGGEIAGFVDCRLEQSPDPMHRDVTYCHVVEIAVSGRHQGHGIGGQLLRAAEDWGRERGATFVSLEYLANNSGAAAFYRRLNYRVVSTTAIKRL